MDIFISYRRDTGGTQAALIKSELEKMNISVFFDSNSIHNEDFMEKIKRAIDHCPNFLMVVSEGYYKKRVGEDDYVREELLYAMKTGKNIIGIMTSDYDPSEVNWDDPDNEDIRILKTKNCYKYEHGNDHMTKAFYESKIIRDMIDQNGERFSTQKKLETNSWYSEHGRTEADTLWIKTDHIVCRELDWEILEKAITEEKIFEGKTELSLLCYDAYDISTYKKKYDLRPRKSGEKELPVRISNIYGICYSGQLEEANETFGEGHFIAEEEADADDYMAYIELAQKLMERNGIDGFDIIDLTLVLKDNKKPDKTLTKLTKLLNRDGGIIYIRDLDDDYVDMYPDEKGILPKLKHYLDLDKGAGNRHLGKSVYTMLRRSGAKKVYMSDKIITSANYDPNFHAAMFMNYFSYLQPEFKVLCRVTDKDKPEYQEYSDALFWIDEYFDDIESMFRAPDFYFRAGYVAGYAVYKKNNFELY